MYRNAGTNHKKNRPGMQAQENRRSLSLHCVILLKMKMTQTIFYTGCQNIVVFSYLLQTWVRNKEP